MAYAREGAKIVVCDLADDAEHLPTPRKSSRLISEAGGEVELFQGDASDTTDMQRSSRRPSSGSASSTSWSTTPTLAGAIRALRATSSTRPRMQLYQGWFLPFKAAYVNTQLAARQMIEQGRAAQVITITSVHQERAWGWDSIYGSMKAGAPVGW